ncbi:lytic transglycosylase domain-containing protein [Acinetobacter variabilis]|uniref:lytic transglycosylase domain-containing protein n=1 Tax=Acinetobacter variabilis TaxID=70346 RepID=UPI0028A9A48B|nr:lytic transglycosylase domain-containing protein [Acinetobacter variabilis]
MKAVITGMVISLFCCQAAFASLSDDNKLHELVRKCTAGINADSKIAIGIVKTESAGNPLSIGVNSKGVKLKRQPNSLVEAIEVATWLATNRYNFDAGIAQINSVNIEKLVKGDVNFRMRKIFDPCENLQLAKIIFNSCYEMTGTTVGALSCYNTGNAKRGVRNGYVAKVMANVPDIIQIQNATKPKIIRKNQKSNDNQQGGSTDTSDDEKVSEGEKNKKEDLADGDAFDKYGSDDVFNN